MSAPGSVPRTGYRARRARSTAQRGTIGKAAAPRDSAARGGIVPLAVISSRIHSNAPDSASPRRSPQRTQRQYPTASAVSRRRPTDRRRTGNHARRTRGAAPAGSSDRERRPRTDDGDVLRAVRVPGHGGQRTGARTAAVPKMRKGPDGDGAQDHERRTRTATPATSRTGRRG